MNISKALKVKNRMVGEINRLREIFRRENSRRNDNPSKVNVAEIEASLFTAVNNLIKLKGAINKASALISEKLALLAETKAEINFLESVPSREGEELTLIGSNREKLSYQWTAYRNKEALDKKISQNQGLVNLIQDEIDDFNAKTQVEFEG